MYGMSREDEVFLSRIMPKLTPNDIYILNSLQEITTPQLGLTREEIKTELKKSEFNIFLSINRLELIGCVTSLKVGRTNQYSISEFGLKVLEILQNG